MKLLSCSTICALVATMSGCSAGDGTTVTDGRTGDMGDMGETGEEGPAGDRGETGEVGNSGEVGPAGESTSVLRLNLTGLENLGPDYAYEGWLIVDGAPVSTGIFHVNSDGQQTGSTFAVQASALTDASTFVLTIEPVPDVDPAPSNVHILAGDFGGDVGQLSTQHAAALGSDFTTATGSYVLNTPSTGANMDDYSLGIWWLDPSGAAPQSSLQLPELPAGWIYEGWVVDVSAEVPEPVSTGTFTDAEGADSDSGGSTAGMDGVPPFPGQDFINPARDLVAANYRAVISIEPVPDNNPGPFLLKPLVDDIEDVLPPLTQSMSNGASNFPSGTVNR